MNSNLISLALIVFLINPTVTNAQNKKYTSVEARKAFYQKLAAKYNSLAVQEILEKDEENAFEDYVEEHTEKSLVEEYSTVVHELYHGYNRSTFEGHFYFIEPGVRIFVPFTELYNSKELNEVIPKSRQDSIFRYSLYVGGGKVGLEHLDIQTEAMSVQQGIYGLLEEYSAYYYGGLAELELYDYYKLRYPFERVEVWESFEHAFMGDVMAYYEFELFIGWYLQHAKKEFPEVYKALYSNKNLRVTYTLMQQRFSKLVQRCTARSEQIISMIKPKVHAPEIDEDFPDQELALLLIQAGMDPREMAVKEISIIDGDTTISYSYDFPPGELEAFKNQLKAAFGETTEKTGSDLLGFHAQHDKAIPYLKSLMTAETQSELDNFKVDGVTIENYQRFLD